MYMCHEMPLITTFDSKLSVAEQSKVLFSQRVMSPISKLLEVAWESEREVSARCPSAASPSSSCKHILDLSEKLCCRCCSSLCCTQISGRPAEWRLPKLFAQSRTVWLTRTPIALAHGCKPLLMRLAMASKAATHFPPVEKADTAPELEGWGLVSAATGTNRWRQSGDE